MNTRLRSFAAASAFVVLGAVSFSSEAGAFGLRVPQVPVLGGTLQGYLNGVGESINVLTDQQNAQVWSQAASGNSLLTLMVEFSGDAGVNTIGVYNALAGAPTLYQIFPGTASDGWFAVMSFRTGPARVVVNLFDQGGALQGTNTYLGIDSANFGFYIQKPGGPVLYSQDGRNPGASAQMLVYQGTGLNSGEWWLCFEDTAVTGGGSDQDYDDAVCVLESVSPLATVPATLGSVKSLYR